MKCTVDQFPDRTNHCQDARRALDKAEENALDVLDRFPNFHFPKSTYKRTQATGEANCVACGLCVKANVKVDGAKQVQTFNGAYQLLPPEHPDYEAERHVVEFHVGYQGKVVTSSVEVSGDLRTRCKVSR